jgi:hypothetical protein
MVPIGVTASNLIIGPAKLYLALFGAAEPPDSAVTPNGPTTPPPSPTWLDVGGTDGGITYEVDTTYTDKTVDQVEMPVGASLTDIAMTVTAKLAEVTLANMNAALNYIGQTSGGSGYSTLDIPAGRTITQPQYSALMIDGWAPYTASGAPALRRVILRKLLSKAKIGLPYDKKTQQGYSCTWTTYWVSDSINPCHIVDQED